MEVQHGDDTYEGSSGDLRQACSDTLRHEDPPGTRGEPASVAGRPLSPHWLRAIVVIWMGQALSIVTSGASGWAIVWHVTQTEQSALMLSLVMVCATLPQGLLSPLGGMVADRFNRKLVMMVADLGAGLVSLTLAAVILYGSPSFALICVCASIRSALTAFHGPAMMAAMPMLVPERQLLRVNTLDQLMASLAGICSPAIGIALYGAFGLPSTLALEFLGALAAVAGLLPVRMATVRERSSTSVLGQLREGWQALAAHKGLVMLLGWLTVGVMAYSAISAVYPLMGTQHFGADGTMVSIAEAVSGSCMLAGAVIIMIWGGGRQLARLLCVSAVLMSLPIIAASLLPPDAFWTYAALMGVASVFMAWFNGPVMTLIQKRVPEDKAGRAIGFFYTSIGVSSPVGVAVGGAIAERIGVAPFFVAAGMLTLALGVVGYGLRDIRALDARGGA